MSHPLKDFIEQGEESHIVPKASKALIKHLLETNLEILKAIVPFEETNNEHARLYAESCEEKNISNENETVENTKIRSVEDFRTDNDLWQKTFADILNDNWNTEKQFTHFTAYGLTLCGFYDRVLKALIAQEIGMLELLPTLFLTDKKVRKLLELGSASNATSDSFIKGFIHNQGNKKRGQRKDGEGWEQIRKVLANITEDKINSINTLTALAKYIEKQDSVNLDRQTIGKKITKKTGVTAKTYDKERLFIIRHPSLQ